MNYQFNGTSDSFFEVTPSDLRVMTDSELRAISDFSTQVMKGSEANQKVALTSIISVDLSAIAMQKGSITVMHITHIWKSVVINMVDWLAVLFAKPLFLVGPPTHSWQKLRLNLSNAMP
jgi:hypothetical protein